MPTKVLHTGEFKENNSSMKKAKREKYYGQEILCIKNIKGNIVRDKEKL